jgi:tetratricopeptide (TPR) repeat protein
MTRAIAMLLLVVTVPVTVTAARAEEEPAPAIRHYLDARKMLFDDDLESAVELFGRVVREHPDADVADDALYWMAWAHRSLPDGRPRAVEAYLRLLRRYPESPWLDEAAAALRESGRDEALGILRKRLNETDKAAARRYAVVALAALRDESVLPELEKRLSDGDVEAAIGLSRLGTGGVAALETALKNGDLGPAARTAAFRGYARAALAEKAVKPDRATKVLVEIETDETLLPLRREIRGLIAALRPDEKEEDLAETVRRLRREVAELKKQVADLETIVRKRLGRK